MLTTHLSPSAKRIAVSLLLATVLFGGFLASRAWADQPHMEAALRHLQAAKQELEIATPDKGGHRANAILLINDAMDQVERGMEVAGRGYLPLPPPVAFGAPPAVIVLPDTDDVYAVPDARDMYFWDGWWWRYWEGRWYRSHYYDRDWDFYDRVPNFYFDVDPDWGRYYRDHDWHGHRWDYDRIPYDRLQQNWQNWHNDRHWEREGTWGVRNYRPRPQQEREQFRQQREREYHQRPEVQQEQKRREQTPELQQEERQRERRPEVQQEQRRREQRPEVQQEQRQREERPELQQEQRRRERPQAPQSQEKPEEGQQEYRR